MIPINNQSASDRPVMNLWLVRHGQTDWNKAKLMQGHSDIPLNSTGIRQAENAAKQVKDLDFDAVYSSPLSRAIMTASIISRRGPEKIMIDQRLIEADFGKYEKQPYYLLGPAMTAYWSMPEIFPAPESVETIESMVSRSTSFFRDLEQMPYHNVLISCHGGILRVLKGYLEQAPKGIVWRPKPHNCEFRVYQLKDRTWTKIPHPAVSVS